MNSLPLCFDFQSTTPCDQEVLDAMEPYWQEYWGNPSSKQNRSGIYASAAVSCAREQIAKIFQVAPNNVIFTSGATEANNLALIGFARAKAQEIGKPGHLITISTEHHAVLDPLRQLQKEGFRLTELVPEDDGLLSQESFSTAFQEDTVLASVMFANNEIGVIQPINKFASFCRSKNVTFHCDAVQAFGYVPIKETSLDIDLISLNAHKIYGPKGVGVLINRRNLPLMPLQWGGGQEFGLRPGTLPVPLIIGMAKAFEIALRETNKNNKKLQYLRNLLLKDLQEKVPNLIINGSIENRLPHNLNITVTDVIGSRLHSKLKPVIACSSGSACSNGSPSHVLIALGRSINESSASLRLSIGKHTTISEIKKAAVVISEIVENLRN